jgi:hypothetical protein
VFGTGVLTNSLTLAAYATPPAFFMMGFFKIGSPQTILLAWNHNPPDHCLLSSYDYRCEVPVPGPNIFLKAPEH